jgi:predicted  nucleic acid-binding Zn-ribbon protein
MPDRFPQKQAVVGGSPVTAVRQLYYLQAVDLKLDHKRARLQIIAAALGNEGELPALRAQLRAVEVSVAHVTGQQRQLDQETATLVERITQAEGKLYGGRVVNPRELSDLQADIGQLNRQRSQQDDQTLQVMVELEGLQSKAEGGSAALRIQEDRWRTRQTSMAEEHDTLQAEVAELEAERDRLAIQMPPSDLSLYDQVRRSHGGKVVALVDRGVCESCRVGLPTGLLQSVRLATTPVRCSNCGLMLLSE